MSNFMKVLLIQPGTPARTVVMPKDQNAVRSFLGGHLRLEKYWNDGTAFLFNGKPPGNDNPPNRLIAEGRRVIGMTAGDLIIVRYKDDGSFDSLPEDLLKMYKKKFFVPDLFMKTGEGMYTVLSGELGKPPVAPEE